MAENLRKPRDNSPEDDRPASEPELASRSAGEEEKAPKLPPVKARQGERGIPVLLVLIAGLILVALVWWGAEIYGNAIAPENPSGGSAEPALDQ